MIDWNYDLAQMPRDDTKILVSYRVRRDNSPSVCVVRFNGKWWVNGQNDAQRLILNVEETAIYAWAPLPKPA